MGIPDRFADIAFGVLLVPTELSRFIRMSIAVVLAATLALPILETPAASDLYPGAPATIASQSAPFASIKSDPDPAAVEIIQVDNGLPAAIVAGPLPGSDGLLWYQIEVSGVVGYIAERDLGWGTVEETAPTVIETEAPPVVTGNGVVVSTDGAEIACVASPSWDGAWIFSYSSGSLVDLAGQPTDGWQPVMCATQLGYVPSSMVYDPAHVPTPAPIETEIISEETEIVEIIEPTEIPDVIETVVIPEETTTEELPETTETIELTEEPVITETPTSEEPAATEEIPVTETETPVSETTEPSETSEPNETVVEETATPVEETAIPEVIDTETVGQTVSVDDQPVFAASIVGAATVYNTGAGGLRCRSGASLHSAILMVLPLGATVSLTGNASNGWQPVTCGGRNGFVAARFLQTAGGSSTGDGSVDTSATLTGSTGVVRDTGGVGLRCRTGASYDASIITVLSEGTTVISRGAAAGVWQPVTCAGQAGFVHTDFIGTTSSGGNNSGGGSGSTAGSAVVSGTNGDGVRFRASAGYDGSVIAVLLEGTSVTLRTGSVGSWTAVTYGGRNGFVYADYLSTSRNPSPGGGSGSGVGSTGLGAGNNARVTDTLNFRGGASYSASVLGVATIGTVVRVTGSPSGGFYPVTWGGTAGYMHGDYLTYTTAALSTTGPNSGVGGSTGGGSGAGSGSGSASGQSLVSYAMRYLGYPYVWATHGPNSFDCSGFTYWVVKNVLGRDIGAGTWTQWGTGAPIQYGNLQPGDLVFFQNTYTTGLSHVGMYIGNDQFIHAENENTGVRISSLTSNYYSTRYLGARRLT
ncbi:MAG: SH3 domain-containing protein [Thermomicrobiales bacterium]|nr:SH3 domain-containing protein [Thermomicrobiales bacterium]